METARPGDTEDGGLILCRVRSRHIVKLRQDVDAGWDECCARTLARGEFVIPSTIVCSKQPWGGDLAGRTLVHGARNRCRAGYGHRPASDGNRPRDGDGFD